MGRQSLLFGGAVKGGKVLGQYPKEFLQGDEDKDGVVLSRGRLIPTSPWDTIWKGVAEWLAFL